MKKEQTTIVNEQPKAEELSIKDLKSEVYDRMMQVENLSLQMQQLQKEVQQINQQIYLKVEKEKEPGK